MHFLTDVTVQEDATHRILWSLLRLFAFFLIKFNIVLKLEKVSFFFFFSTEFAFPFGILSK